MNIVTLMDYPDDAKYNRMSMIWMKHVRQHAPGARVTVLTAGGLPESVREYFGRFPGVEIRKAGRKNIGIYDHYNLAVKLYNLAKLDFPFLFLDADMVALSDLDYLWQRRNDKPWIGVPIQLLPGFHRPEKHAGGLPRLNSGLQLVSDPSFYDYDKIVECFTRSGRSFQCAGEDQVLLHEYFKSIGYDYRHPEIGPGWNACSKFVRLFKDERGVWHSETQGLPEKYPVHIVHYWNGACRPWNLDCPLFKEEGRLSESLRTPSPARRSDSIRVCVMNAAPDILQKPGEHPFYPLKKARVKCVGNPDDADYIFWHLDPAAPQKDYEKLVYTQSEFFKRNEDRFVLYSSARNPGWFYLNNALCFTPHPVYGRDKNRLSRVIPIPCCSPGTPLPGEPKRYTVSCPASVERLVRSGLGAEDAANLKVIRDPREIAQAKYYVHVESDAAGPMWLYEAMSAGAVPVIVGMPDLPFAESVDWSEFAIFPMIGKNLSQIFQSLENSYETRRRKTLDFWNAYCEPAARNERIVSGMANGRWQMAEGDG